MVKGVVVCLISRCEFGPADCPLTYPAGLTHLIGTPLLRAYMHGFFMDIRLYNKVCDGKHLLSMSGMQNSLNSPVMPDFIWMDHIWMRTMCFFVQIATGLLSYLAYLKLQITIFSRIACYNTASYYMHTPYIVLELVKETSCHVFPFRSKRWWIHLHMTSIARIRSDRRLKSPGPSVFSWRCGLLYISLLGGVGSNPGLFLFMAFAAVSQVLQNILDFLAI